MGAILASAIVDDIEQTLADPTNTRWDASVHLGHINDGIRVLALLKPEVYVKTATRQLIAGHRQTFPSDANGRGRPSQNRGTAGTTQGDMIVEGNLSDMNSAFPSWPSSTPSRTVEQYFPDPVDETVYFVYPPQPATGMGYVEETYPAIPAAITLGQAIPVSDTYKEFLYYYGLARAYSEEIPEGSEAKAGGYFQIALNLLGLKDNAEATLDIKSGKVTIGPKKKGVS